MSHRTLDGDATARHVVATDRLRRAYVWLVIVAAAWAIANCAYVYFLLNGGKIYRIESSVYILVALLLPGLLLYAERPAPAPNVRATPIIVLCIVTWIAIVWPLRTAPFLSDDYVFVDVYKGGPAFGHRWEFFRPTFGLLFFALLRLGHVSPTPFHLVAWLLHLSNAGMVLAVTRRLWGSTLAAAIAFAVFLLNPLQLEATLWISGLQELLWSFCVLAALIVHSGRRELSGARISAAAALALVALLSKETAVCFLPLVVLLDFALYRFDRGRWRLVGAYVAYGVVLIVYLLVRQRVASFDARFVAPPTRFFAKQFVALPYKMFTQPWNVEAVDVPSIALFISALSAILLLCVVIVRRRVSLRLLIGPAIILISTLPLYRFFFVAENLASARYLYFPAAGWAILLGYLLTRATRNGVIVAAMLAALAGTYTVSLIFNLRPWRTAGQLIVRLEEAVPRGTPLDGVVRQLQSELGSSLEVRDGIPQQYQGVGLFINGYSEFVDLARRK